MAAYFLRAVQGGLEGKGLNAVICMILFVFSLIMEL